MIKNKFTKKFLSFKNINDNFGFGLVDAIVSISLLSGVITYGIYFSSLRLNTVYKTNLTTSINKEIERDIERLKLDFWGMYFEESDSCKGEYCLANGDNLPSRTCEDFTQDIVTLNSWNIQGKSSNLSLQTWKPDERRSKIFTGKPVTISRELTIKSPLDMQFLNKTVASISYRVLWSDKNIHWLSILISPEAHSWCENII
tara:strand:- start:580 stop:1182 length:603 start_codon:yes stop_codon:yes gene_type:complete